MDTAVECTHCLVTMTTWSVPGSPVRYFQCPFCQRTHSSTYDEVFAHQAGARLVGTPARAAAAGLPMASRQEIAWAGVKARASRWFARLEAEEARARSSLPRLRPLAQPAVRPAPAAAALAAQPARHR